MSKEQVKASDLAQYYSITVFYGYGRIKYIQMQEITIRYVALKARVDHFC